MKRWEARESGLLVPGRCDIGIHLGVTMLLMGGGGSSSDLSLYGILNTLGLLGNCVLCLDAGDSASTDGSSQTWTDRSSGANSFYRGANNSVTTDDPTFNGVAGALTSSEYWSFDGGDFFSLVSGANPAAFETFHKNNAAWSGLAAIYLGATTAQAVMGTRGGGFVPGFELRIGDSGATMRLGVDEGGGSFGALDKTGGSTFSTGQWYVIGWSLNEATGAGGGFLWRNGAYNQVGGTDTFDATYTSPSASSAGFALNIGASGNGAAKVPNNTRVACVALFTTALSKTQMDNIYNGGLKTRLGL